MITCRIQILQPTVRDHAFGQYRKEEEVRKYPQVPRVGDWIELNNERTPSGSKYYQICEVVWGDQECSEFKETAILRVR